MKNIKTKTIYNLNKLLIIGAMIAGNTSNASEVTSCEMNPEIRSQLQKLYSDSCSLSKRELKNMTFDSIVFAKGGKVENALAFLALKGFTFNEVAEMTGKKSDQNLYRSILANSLYLDKKQFGCDEKKFAKQVKLNIFKRNKEKLKVVQKSCNQLVDSYNSDKNNFLIQFKNGKVEPKSISKRRFAKEIIKECVSDYTKDPDALIILNRDNNPAYPISFLDSHSNKIDSLLSSSSWANLEATKWEGEKAKRNLKAVEDLFTTASNLIFTGVKYKCEATIGLAAKVANKEICDRIIGPVQTTYNHFVMNGGEIKSRALSGELLDGQRKRTEKTIVSGAGRFFIKNELLRNTLTTGFDLVRNHDCSSSDQAQRQCVIKVTKKFTQDALEK